MKGEGPLDWAYVNSPIPRSPAFPRRGFMIWRKLADLAFFTAFAVGDERQRPWRKSIARRSAIGDRFETAKNEHGLG